LLALAADFDTRRSYRSLEQSIVVGIFGALGSALMLLFGLAMSMESGAALVVGLLMALGGVSGCWLTFRAVRAGVRTNERGVVIMTPSLGRDTTITWEELERFSIGEKSFWPRVGIAHLRDGSTVAIWGIQGPNPAIRPKNRSAERLIEALNAELRNYVPR
jgi:hypothetical protein